MILVALICFYNAFLNQQFQTQLHFTYTLWFQEDHSSLLSGVGHDENMKLPKSFPSLGIQVLKIHLQLGTWSRYIILVDIYWETMKSHVRRKEIVYIIAYKSGFNQKMAYPFRKKGLILCCPFVLAHGLGRRWNWIRNLMFKHMKYYILQNCNLLWLRNRMWFEVMIQDSSLSISIELISQHGPSMVLLPGSNMVQQKAFFKKKFTSRLFIAVKMLLKYNHKVLPGKFMLDKTHK